MSSLRASVIRRRIYRSRSLHLWLTQSKILGRQEQVPHAARHNPFVYFHSLDVQDGRQSADCRSLVDSGACAKNVVPLNDKTLAADLASIATRPNYAFITPNLCNGGHDVPCRMPGSPSTLADENAFLQEWVPIIVHSPAFQADGLLMITFDESGAALGSADGNTAIYDGSACCNEPGGANTQLPGLGRLAAQPQIAHGLLPPDEYASTVGHSGGGRRGRFSSRRSSNPERLAPSRTATIRPYARSKTISAFRTLAMPRTRGRPISDRTFSVRRSRPTARSCEQGPCGRRRPRGRFGFGSTAARAQSRVPAAKVISRSLQEARFLRAVDRQNDLSRVTGDFSSSTGQPGRVGLCGRRDCASRNHPRPMRLRC